MKVRVRLDELEAAIKELKARGKDAYITLHMQDERSIILSATDSRNNNMEAKIYDNNNLGAEFKYISRLMYMDDKKR